MGNFFAKSTVKDIVNDPEIMEPLASTASSAVKKVVTDPEVISAAKEIITDPKITTVLDSFRHDIVGEMKLGVGEMHLARVQAIDQMQLARGEVLEQMKVAIDQLKQTQGQVIDQMKFARSDAAIYFGIGAVLALVVAGCYFKFRPTPTIILPPPAPPPPPTPIVNLDFSFLPTAPNDGLRLVLVRVDPSSFRLVRFPI